jgi:hypothetical protein
VRQKDQAFKVSLETVRLSDRGGRWWWGEEKQRLLDCSSAPVATAMPMAICSFLCLFPAQPTLPVINITSRQEKNLGEKPFIWLNEATLGAVKEDVS